MQDCETESVGDDDDDDDFSTQALCRRHGYDTWTSVGEGRRRCFLFVVTSATPVLCCTVYDTYIYNTYMIYVYDTFIEITVFVEIRLVVVVTVSVMKTLLAVSVRSVNNISDVVCIEDTNNDVINVCQLFYFCVTSGIIMPDLFVYVNVVLCEFAPFFKRSWMEYC